MSDKPIRKSDKELYTLLSKKIPSGEYFFKKHAKERLNGRKISELDVLDILEGRPGRGRCRNKSKDKHVSGRRDWNYCIEGVSLEQEKIRIIISFEENLIPIITVMWA